MKDIYENYKLHKEEIELLEELENIFLEYGDKDLLNEGIMDRMIDKLDQFLNRIYDKVVQLAAKAKSKALSLLSSASKVVGRFAEKFPKLKDLTKGVSLVLAMAVIATVLTTNPSTAQADLKYKGKLVTQEQVDAAKGTIQNLINNDATGDLQWYLTAAEYFQNLREDPGSHTVEKAEGELKKAMVDTLDFLEKKKKKDPKRYSAFVKIGKKLVVYSPDGNLTTDTKMAKVSKFQGKNAIVDMVKGHYEYNNQKNQDITNVDFDQIGELIHLYIWKTTGKWDKKAPDKIKKLVTNFTTLSKGKPLDPEEGEKMSIRYNYMEKVLKLGKKKIRIQYQPDPENKPNQIKVGYL